MIIPILKLAYWSLGILRWLILIDIVLTWIPLIPPRHPIVVLIRQITQPILRPLSRVIPSVRLGNAFVDISPIIAFIGISIVQSIIVSIIRGLILAPLPLR